MTRPLGTDLTICRNTSSPASWSAPAWTKVRGLHDIKLDISPGAMIKSSDRGSGFDTEIPARLKIAVDGNMLWNHGDGQKAIRDAFVNQTPIELAVLFGTPATGKKGVHIEWAVTQFNADFPLNDGQKIAFKLQPSALYTNAPVYDYTDASADPGTAETVSPKRTGAVAVLAKADGTPITAAMDIKLNLQPAGVVDMSDRDSIVDVVMPTRFKVEPEFSFLWNPGNSDLAAIRTAVLAGTGIEYFILDGPYATAGSWGVHSTWAISGFPLDAKLSDGQRVTVKLTPHGDGATAPEFKTIS